jgi:hypothetical protein
MTPIYEREVCGGLGDACMIPNRGGWVWLVG